MRCLNNFSDVKHVENIKITDKREGVVGLVMFENKIFSIFSRSTQIHVFRGETPYDSLEDECFVIPEMKEPTDMTSVTAVRSIFISGWENQCFWKIQMPDKAVKQNKFDGWPHGLSTTLMDELVVWRGGINL